MYYGVDDMYYYYNAPGENCTLCCYTNSTWHDLI